MESESQVASTLDNCPAVGKSDHVLQASNAHASSDLEPTPLLLTGLLNYITHKAKLTSSMLMNIEYLCMRAC